MKFLKSFGYAFRGIVFCLKNERNMRVHATVAVYVLVFSLFFALSREQYALLFLAIAGVMSAEMFNTAAEKLADQASEEYNPLVRIAKDVAAGAVLICAIFAVVVGICLFWQPAVFWQIALFFGARLWLCALLVLSFAASLCYVAWGPAGIKQRLRKLKRRGVGRRRGAQEGITPVAAPASAQDANEGEKE
ncbi:MAG TPA: diacylglycerol kinase family protein [Candidatus Gallacutalibacter stercoravium]|nr:diacylglycerol kinase family protein [Candidatus Gallacutalibacter stercoravium]